MNRDNQHSTFLEKTSTWLVYSEHSVLSFNQVRHCRFHMHHMWYLKCFLCSCISYLSHFVACCPAVLSSNHREALLDKESEMTSMLEKLRLREAEIQRMREDEAQRASYLQSAILTYVQGSPLGHYSSTKKWPWHLHTPSTRCTSSLEKKALKRGGHLVPNPRWFNSAEQVSSTSPSRST